MRDFYRDRLQIDDDELHNIAWDAVVQRIVELNDRTRLCIVKEQLTPHDIANRILRKENFMVAFVNRDLLPLQWPPPLSRFDFLTKTLEWNLYLCILDAMFDGDFKVRRSFTQDVHGVRRLQFNFMVVGALNALAFPFIAVVMLVHFFIEHFEELCAARNSGATPAQFRRNSGAIPAQFFRRPTRRLRRYRRPTASAFSRDYSRHARWMMREFNELPHAFDARIHASRDDANRYTEEFPAPLVTLLAGFVTFIVSSLVGVLLALSLINENILLFYRLPEADGDGWG